MASSSTSGFDMIFLSIQLVLLITSPIVNIQAIVVPPFLHIVCSNEKGNFTNGSTYQENIKGLLSNRNGTRLYTTYYGDNDTVYGIGFCKSDLSIPQDQYSTCLKNSSHLLIQACPNQKEAIIWNEDCMLRYSNHSIYCLLELTPVYNQSITKNISSWDVYTLNQELVEILQELRNVTAADGGLRKFQNYMARSKSSNNQSINGLMQCTPKLRIVLYVVLNLSHVKTFSVFRRVDSIGT